MWFYYPINSYEFVKDISNDNTLSRKSDYHFENIEDKIINDLNGGVVRHV